MPTSRLIHLCAAALIVITLTGCGAITAQNPSGNYRPVNAVADDPEARLLLKGADVTAYFTQGQYVQGNAQFRSSYEGVDFRFASAEAKALVRSVAHPIPAAVWWLLRQRAGLRHPLGW